MRNTYSLCLLLLLFATLGIQAQTLVIDQSRTIGSLIEDPVVGDVIRDDPVASEANESLTGTVISTTPAPPPVIIDLSGFREPEEDPTDYKMLAYPVPAHDEATVRLDFPEPGRGVLRLLDMNGQVHNSLDIAWRAGQQEIQADLVGLAPGVYLLDLETPTGRVTGRLVKR